MPATSQASRDLGQPPLRRKRMTIISIGYDTELLSLRNAAFQGAGHRVVAASDMSTALRAAHDDRIDSAVLCYTIPLADRQTIIDHLRELNPEIRICSLERNHRAATTEKVQPIFAARRISPAEVQVA
jgi:DNA-binding response OmpR family regulator